jgi:hypothetical protein
VVVAAFFVVFATRAAQHYLARRRERKFKGQKHQTRQEFAEKLALPALSPSPALTRLESLSALAGVGHQAAIEEQKRYHAAVVACATGLLCGFTANALGLTLLTGRRDIEPALATIEIVSIVLVIFYYLRGRDANERWIAARAAAELERQFVFLALLFPSEIEPGQPRDLTSEFERESARILARVSRT